MKAKTKSINIILTMALMVSILFFSNKVEAASFSVSASNSTVTVGDTFTVTINGKGLTGRYTIAGNSNVSVSETSVWIENESKTVTCTTKAEGTATVTITPQTVADSTTGEDQSLSAKSVSVTVNAKETQKQNNENTESSEGNSENNSSSGSNGESATGGNTTVSEPTFTDTNKTMYSTGNINLRASWSTSSSATSIEEGTELTVTGTSKEKVNGYVWYRVSYNGQTKYVASSLLTSTKPEKEEETKSDNANLKSLVVENFNITPNFSSDVTEYTLEVTSEVTELKISAEPEDSNATVTVEGEKELKEGENTVVISVNAEDGTTKSYEIKVTKKEETVFGLTSLKIKDANIEFKPDIYNYSINIQSDVDILEIQATASEEDATVEIIGNEGLKEGENIITIMVSSKDGEKNATYQIKATKEEEKTSENVQSNIKIYIYAGIGIVALIALIIVIVYTVKHRKEDDLEGFEGFPEELPEKNYNNEINDDEEAQNIELEEKENDIDEQEEIDRKKYFLDTQSEDDFENIKKKRGKHF